MLKALIDTNILVDFFVEDRPSHEMARRIMYLVLNGRMEAEITTQSFLDTVYICGRATGRRDAQLRKSLKELRLRTNVSFIDSFELGDALGDADPDIEDSAHISHAYHSGCDVIITNDKALLSREMPAPMKALSPEEFLRLCQ